MRISTYENPEPDDDNVHSLALNAVSPLEGVDPASAQRASDAVNDEWVREGRYPETASPEDEREFWTEVRERAMERGDDAADG